MLPNSESVNWYWGGFGIQVGYCGIKCLAMLLKFIPDSKTFFCSQVAECRDNAWFCFKQAAEAGTEDAIESWVRRVGA